MPSSACRHSTVAVIAAVIGLLVPAALAAQTCLGTAPLPEGGARGGVIGAHNERAQSLGVSLNVGLIRGLFGGASLSRLWIDVAEDPSPAFVAIGGYAVDVNWPRDLISFQACPFATFESVKGPQVNLGPGIPRLYVETNAYRGGLSIGGAVLAGTWYAIVPTGSISYVREVANTWQAGITERISDDYGLLDGGIGLVIKHTFTLQGGVSVPLRLPGVPPTVLVSIGLNFGTPY